MEARPSLLLDRRYARAVSLALLLVAGLLVFSSLLPSRVLEPRRFLQGSFCLASFCVFVLWPASFSNRRGALAEACGWLVLWAPLLYFGARFSAAEGSLLPALARLSADLVLLSGLARLCARRPGLRLPVSLTVFVLGVLWPAVITAARDLELVELPALLPLLWFRAAAQLPTGAESWLLAGQLLLGVALWFPDLRRRAGAALLLGLVVAAASGPTLEVAAAGSSDPGFELEVRHLLAGRLRPGEGSAVLLELHSQRRVRGELVLAEGQGGYVQPIDLPANARRTFVLPFVPHSHLARPLYSFQASDGSVCELQPLRSPPWSSLGPSESLVGLLDAQCPPALEREQQVRLSLPDLEQDPSGWLLGGLDLLIGSAELCRELPPGVEAWVARGGLLLALDEAGDALQARLADRVRWQEGPHGGTQRARGALGSYWAVVSSEQDAQAWQDLREELSAEVRTQRKHRSMTSRRLYLSWRELQRSGALPDPLPEIFFSGMPLLALLVACSWLLLWLLRRRQAGLYSWLMLQAALGLACSVALTARLPAGWATASEARVRVQTAGAVGAVDLLAFTFTPDRVYRELELQLPRGLATPVLARPADYLRHASRVGEGTLRFDLNAARLFNLRDALDEPGRFELRRLGVERIEVVHRGSIPFDSAFVRLGPRLYPLGRVEPGQRVELRLDDPYRALVTAHDFATAQLRAVVLGLCGPRQLCLIGYEPLSVVELGLPSWLAERQTAPAVRLVLE